MLTVGDGKPRSRMGEQREVAPSIRDCEAFDLCPGCRAKFEVWMGGDADE